MKKTIIAAVLLISIAALSFKPAHDAAPGLAQVIKMNGKHIYIASEPVAAYDVAFDFKTNINAVYSCPGIYETAQQCVESAIKQGKKTNIDFDGIIIGSGKKDLAIKYK